MLLSIIAAIAENNAIGNQGDLIYHLPDDLKRFKQLTTGHTVIMGRKTFESLPHGPLPNRRNIVITSNPDWSYPDIEVARSIEEAVLKANPTEPLEEVFIIGGASIYSEMLKRSLVDRIYITEIKDTPENADVFFPEIPEDFDVEFAECHSADEHNAYDYCFVNYKKNRK